LKMSTPYKIFKKLFRLKSIKQVYENDISTKATRGIDKIGVKTFNKNKIEHLKVVYKKCNNGRLKFSPYVEKLQSKGRNKKPRVISVATIRDRTVLFLLKELLHEIFPDCVHRKLPNNYIKEIKDFYEKNGSKHVCYLKTDIKSFYDNIDHDILLKILRKKIRSKLILALLKRAIKTPTVPNNYKRSERHAYKRKFGVPQGLSISNILANIYLEGIDGKLGRFGLKYFRYVDDMLHFLGDEKPDEIENTIKDELERIKLKINESKTECSLTDHSFDYLGYKLSLPKVSIKDSNVDRFLTSVAAKFSTYNHNSASQRKKYTWLTKRIQMKVFVDDLNEKLTGALSDSRRYGWLFYFLEINDMELLHKLDAIIEQFFTRLQNFGKCAPTKLKKISKAYYKAKYDPYGGYIHNYEIYDSLKKKISYLSNRGYLNPKGHYKQTDIELIFNRVKRKRLIDLDLDVGLIS